MFENRHLVTSAILLLITTIGSLYLVEMRKHSEIFIPDVEPVKVFGVFGNFTNFFLLEPNLIAFKLKAEYDGNKMVNITTKKYNEFVTNHRERLLDNNQSWSYVVWYEEYYQYLPSILSNKNKGHYNTRPKAVKVCLVLLKPLLA